MSVLVLAPHADDEVLGVGATIAKLVESGEEVSVCVLTGSGGARKHPFFDSADWEIVRSECRSACDILGVHNLSFRELPASCLDHIPTWEINQVVQQVIEETRPEQLYIPFANDLHRDHGCIAYATSVATRAYLPLGKSIKRILAYETLSETHLAPAFLEVGFQPNYYVDVSEHLEKKVAAFKEYKSQKQTESQPRSVRSIRALASLRGGAIGVDAAEAYILLRQIG